MSSVDESVELVESYIKSCKTFLQPERDDEFGTPSSTVQMTPSKARYFGTPRLSFGSCGDSRNYSKRSRLLRDEAVFDDSTFDFGKTPNHRTFERRELVNCSTPVQVSKSRSDLVLQSVQELDLPVFKKTHEYLRFPENTSKERFVTTVLQVLCWVYSIAIHPRTRSTLQFLMKCTVDILFALTYLGVSVLLSLVTCGEQLVAERRQKRRNLELVLKQNDD